MEGQSQSRKKHGGDGGGGHGGDDEDESASSESRCVEDVLQAVLTDTLVKEDTT
jgi:hypothetical protein